MVTLAVDAMGGDFGPQVTIPAVLQALKLQKNLRVLLLGDQSKIQQHLPAGCNLDRLEVLHCNQTVDMTDSPSQTLRAKKQSSMALMLHKVSDGSVGGCISAGNTGALMVLSRHILQTFDAIDRPAIVSALPQKNGQCTFMLDLGANVGCDSELLYQFALMGRAVAQAFNGIEQPRIALLNIGSEEVKGNDQVKSANELLRNDDTLNYIGYIEGSDLFSHKADVVVCDGFVGNVVLKTIEGLARYFMSEIRIGIFNRWWLKLLAPIFKPILGGLDARLNPGAYNGALLVGLRGVVVKSHGDANTEEFLQAILTASHYVERKLPEKIADHLGGA